MSALGPRFVRFVRSRGLFRPGDRVLVALSGGVDSVVLLHLLKANEGALELTVHAAHFDHAMRADSAADADWVQQLCANRQIPLVRARATRTLKSEADARFERYRFLQSAARESASARIATAHHAGDQVETVLFRLLRGTGMRGLAGIPLRRGRFVRPLLRFTKPELLAYAAAHDIAYREDPSNELLNYARNRIRRIVVPALEQVQPRASENIRKLARHAARTETAWRSVLALLADDLVVARDERALELARPVLLEYHPELRARVVRHLLRRFGITPGRMQTRQLVEFCERAASGARVALARRVSLERAFDRIRIVRVPDSGAPDSILPVSGPAGEGAVNLGGRRYDVAWHVSGSRAGDEVFDAALLDAGLEFRAWRAGDRIRLPYGGKKLKKLFGERRIAASERARIPVLSDIRGRVFWVVGVARSVDALPGDGAPGLNITVRHAESR